MSAVGFEYDPHNKLRHTTYWYEDDIKKEWPPSPAAALEEPLLDQDAFDPNATADTFYFNVKTTGAVPPGDVMIEGLEVLKNKLQGLSMAMHMMDREPILMDQEAPNSMLQATAFMNGDLGAGRFFA